MQVKALHNFRLNLRRLMSERGMTTETLAVELDTQRPYVSRLLNGHTNPGLEMCDRIADILGVPVTDLLAEVPDEESEKISA